MIQRFLLAILGTMFLASAAAFFLFVPPLSIAMVALILTGPVLMFCLGFQAGAVGMVPSESVGRQRRLGAPDVLLQIQGARKFKEQENHRNGPKSDREHVA